MELTAPGDVARKRGSKKKANSVLTHSVFVLKEAHPVVLRLAQQCTELAR